MPPCNSQFAAIAGNESGLNIRYFIKLYIFIQTDESRNAAPAANLDRDTRKFNYQSQSMFKEISLKILLQNPVKGTMYGLQKGKGANYETVQAQLGNGQALAFNFTIHVKAANGELFAIAGPFVQGPAGSHFIYIGIGSYAGQAGALQNGRLKVPLPEASFQNTPPDEGNFLWSCTVPGSKEDGKPVFATVKPFVGWSMSTFSD